MLEDSVVTFISNYRLIKIIVAPNECATIGCVFLDFINSYYEGDDPRSVHFYYNNNEILDWDSNYEKYTDPVFWKYITVFY